MVDLLDFAPDDLAKRAAEAQLEYSEAQKRRRVAQIRLGKITPRPKDDVQRSIAFERRQRAKEGDIDALPALREEENAHRDFLAVSDALLEKLNRVAKRTKKELADSVRRSVKARVDELSAQIQPHYEKYLEATKEDRQERKQLTSLSVGGALNYELGILMNEVRKEQQG